MVKYVLTFINIFILDFLHINKGGVQKVQKYVI